VDVTVVVVVGVGLVGTVILPDPGTVLAVNVAAATTPTITSASIATIIKTIASVFEWPVGFLLFSCIFVYLLISFLFPALL
jgi:hypothetical protein